LFTREIRGELQKISNEMHYNFFGETSKLLCVISNKPLAKNSGNYGVPNFEEVKRSLEMGRLTPQCDTITKGVIVYSHETLREFIPPILCMDTIWRGLVPPEKQKYTLDKAKEAEEIKAAKKADKVTRGKAKEEVPKQAQQTAPITRKKRVLDEINNKNNEDGDLTRSDGERVQPNKRSRQQSTNEAIKKPQPTANGLRTRSQTSNQRKTNQHTSTEETD